MDCLGIRHETFATRMCAGSYGSTCGCRWVGQIRKHGCRGMREIWEYHIPLYICLFPFLWFNKGWGLVKRLSRVEHCLIVFDRLPGLYDEFKDED